MASPHECATLLLTTIPALMHRLHDAVRRIEIDGETLTIGQFRILAMLSVTAYTLRTLAARHHVAPSTMSRSMRLLVQKALVQRTVDPADGRQVLFTLTDAGRAVHTALRQSIQDAILALFEQLTPAELGEVVDGLLVLQSLLSENEASIGTSVAC